MLQQRLSQPSILPRSHVTDGYTRMIAIFDEDGGGDVDFQEFVLGLSAFSSKGNKEEKLKFAFKVYDIDRDGYISNGELFIVLKMMVGSNLKDQQLQQIVDKTIMEADKDGDGKISFEEFCDMVENTDVSMSMTLGKVDLLFSTHMSCSMTVVVRPIRDQGSCGISKAPVPDCSWKILADGIDIWYLSRFTTVSNIPSPDHGATCNFRQSCTRH